MKLKKILNKDFLTKRYHEYVYETKHNPKHNRYKLHLKSDIFTLFPQIIYRNSHFIRNINRIDRFRSTNSNNNRNRVIYVITRFCHSGNPSVYLNLCDRRCTCECSLYKNIFASGLIILFDTNS